MRLAEILAVGSLALDEIRHRVEAEPVDPEIEPEIENVLDLAHHQRVVEIEVGLAGIEAVPVIRLGDRVPGPVRHLGIDEDDAGFLVFVAGVAPHVIVALGAAGRGAAGALEPRVLVGAVVDDQLGDDADVAGMRLFDEVAEIVERAISRIDRLVVRDVVAVVAQRRLIERQQPDRVGAEVFYVIEPLRQPAKVADPIIVGVVKSADMQLVDDRVLVPELTLISGGREGVAFAFFAGHFRKMSIYLCSI